MKKLLLASLMLSSCACFAHVRSGPNGTYTVDNYGSGFDMPTESPKDKIKFVSEIEARQDAGFKGKGVIALY